jgi:hypothetical protein
VTLTEAVASGKKFKRTSVGGDFLTYEEYHEEYGFERQDILATDYELEPIVTLTLTEDQFAAAWNNARGTALRVKPAGETEFYKKLVSNIKALR